MIIMIIADMKIIIIKMASTCDKEKEDKDEDEEKEQGGGEGEAQTKAGKLFSWISEIDRHDNQTIKFDMIISPLVPLNKNHYHHHDGDLHFWPFWQEGGPIIIMIITIITITMIILIITLAGRGWRRRDFQTGVEKSSRDGSGSLAARIITVIIIIWSWWEYAGKPLSWLSWWSRW